MAMQRRMKDATQKQGGTNPPLRCRTGEYNCLQKNLRRVYGTNGDTTNADTVTQCVTIKFMRNYNVIKSTGTKWLEKIIHVKCTWPAWGGRPCVCGSARSWPLLSRGTRTRRKRAEIIHFQHLPSACCRLSCPKAMRLLQQEALGVPSPSRGAW